MLGAMLESWEREAGGSGERGQSLIVLGVAWVCVRPPESPVSLDDGADDMTEHV